MKNIFYIRKYFVILILGLLFLSCVKSSVDTNERNHSNSKIVSTILTMNDSIDLIGSILDKMTDELKKNSERIEELEKRIEQLEQRYLSN